MRYILDADCIIHTLTGHGETINVLKNLTVDDIAVSLITVGEIYEGAFISTNPQLQLDIFREFFAPFHLVSINEPIMERFAEIRSLLRRRGELIADFDLLIGSTALYYDLTVLTYNKRHFKRIPELKIYPHTSIF